MLAIWQLLICHFKSGQSVSHPHDVGIGETFTSCILYTTFLYNHKHSITISVQLPQNIHIAHCSWHRSTTCTSSIMDTSKLCTVPHMQTHPFPLLLECLSSRIRTLSQTHCTLDTSNFSDCLW
jgi:hypothetical protein